MNALREICVSVNNKTFINKFFIRSFVTVSCFYEWRVTKKKQNKNVYDDELDKKNKFNWDDWELCYFVKW